MSNDKAVAYARYSSDSQSEESIESQLKAIYKYAEANDINIVSEYVDRAKSATNTNRPAFQKMLADSKLKVFNMIIVHKLDRFSRDRYDFAISKRLLKLNSVRLVSVLENLDDSPESIIMESLLEGMAAYYSANLSREVKKTMAEHVMQGKHMGGIPPLGYDVNPNTKEYVINEQEAFAVRLIFQMYLKDHGYMSIIETLNNMNYKTKRGNPFGKNSLHEILRNEKYTGTLVYNRTISKDTEGKRNNHKNKKENEIIKLPGKIPCIISPADFQKAQKKAKTNNTKAGSYKAKRTYLLSGLIYCGVCGYAMIGNVKYSKDHIYTAYRCSYRDRTKKCCNKEIRTNHVDSFILHEINELLLNKENVHKIITDINNKYDLHINNQKKEVAYLKKKLTQTEKEIANILSAIKQGVVHKLINEELCLLEKKRNGLKEEIEKLLKTTELPNITEGYIFNILNGIKDMLMTDNIPEIKKFIGQYVKRVEVFEDEICIVFMF